MGSGKDDGVQSLGEQQTKVWTPKNISLTIINQKHAK